MSNAINTTARDLVLICFLSLSYATAGRSPFLSLVGETGIRRIPHCLPYLRPAIVVQRSNQPLADHALVQQKAPQSLIVCC
jgi:hypothetical protein